MWAALGGPVSAALVGALVEVGPHGRGERAPGWACSSPTRLARRSDLHDHAECCIISRWSRSASSGRRGSPAPSCCGSARRTPTSTCGWPPATRRPAPGSPTSTRAWPRPTPTWPSTPTTPPPSTGSTSCSSACPTAPARRSCPSCSGKVGHLVDLAADFRLQDPVALPAVVRRGAHRARAAARLRLRAARAVPRRDPGRRARRHAGLLPDGRRAGPGARSCGPGVVETDRDHRRRRLRRVRRRPAAEAHHHVLRRRRGLHRLRAARPPAHARDGAGPRRVGAVHARTSRR